MSLDKKKLGNWGEDLAARYLCRRGYKVLERNFRSRLGEIDIIAKEGGDLVFVEVKTKSSFAFGLPEERVDKRKQRKLIKTAEYYLVENEIGECSWRIDVIAIHKTPQGVPRFKLIKNAVEL